MLDLADVGDKIPFAVASLEDNVSILGVANLRGVGFIFFSAFLLVLTKVAAISSLEDSICVDKVKD